MLTSRIRPAGLSLSRDRITRISHSLSAERPADVSRVTVPYSLRRRRQEQQRERDRLLRSWTWFDDLLAFFGLSRSRRFYRRPCACCGRSY